MKTTVAMLQRTSIEHATSVSDNGGGSTSTWESGESDVPCRVYSLRVRIPGISGAIGGELSMTEGRVEVKQVLAALLPLDTDVTAGDRLVSITDRRGNIDFPGPLLVDSVGKYPDHLRLTIRKVT